MAQRGRQKGSKNKPKANAESLPVANFDVEFATKLDEETTVVTSTTDLANKKMDELMRRAIAAFDPSNSQYSASLNISQSQNEVTIERINELAVGTQSDLTKTLEVIGIIKQYVNKSDLIGPVYDAIQRNVNTEYKVTYPDYSENRNKTKQVKKAESIIDDFNRQVNIKHIIRDTIPMSYLEGTYILYLRQKDTNWIIDYYPLGVAIISEYSVDGNPVVLIDINELTDALDSTVIMNRKRQPLFFKNVEEIIKENYPEEVYQAYKNKDTYAKLDVNRTGVIRINNMGNKYGLSPIFRSLSDAIYLDNLDNSDMVNNKAKAKKIIHQKLDPKLMGENGEKNGYTEMIYAHNNFLNSWRLPLAVVTTPAYVESLSYVEPSVENESYEKAKDYRTRIFTTLGMSFSDTQGVSGVSTVRMSFSQLLKTIDSIAEQVGKIFERFYMVLFEQNNISLDFLPSVSILNSELLELDVRKSLSQYVFSTLNASYKTAYELLSLDIDDEKARREDENENGYEEIFSPRITANTASGKSVGGGGNGVSGGDSDGVREGTGGRTALDPDKTVMGPDKQESDKERHDALKNM